MDLSPESRTIGIENFRAAIGSPLVRRSFLKQGIEKGIRSGEGLGAHYFGYDPEVAKRLRVGLIGVGHQGGVLIGALNPKFVEVVAIADIRPYSVWRAFHGDHYTPEDSALRPGLMAKFGWKTEELAREDVRVYGPYQELIDHAAADNIEAVMIALPLHLHGPATIAALRAGLHVFTERLMARSVAECKDMARAAKAGKKHLAIGHQRHYSILYDNAACAIQQGLLGDVHYIRTQWHHSDQPDGDTDDWKCAMPLELKNDEEQSGELEKELDDWTKELDRATRKLANETNPTKKAALAEEKTLWTIKLEQKEAQLRDKAVAEQAKDCGYENLQITDGDGRVLHNRPPAEELMRWRLWDRTSAGLAAELATAEVFLSALNGGASQLPLNVSAARSQILFSADREIDDHLFCMFEYPMSEYDPDDDLNKRKKITVSCAAVTGSDFGGDSETVFGTKGTLVIEQEKDALLFRTHYVDEKTIVTEDLGAAQLEQLPEGDKSAVQQREESTAIGFQATAGGLSRGYTEEIEHWVYCIRKNPEAKDDGPAPRCRAEAALEPAVIALTARLAARGPGRINFKPEWFDVDSDETPEGVKPSVAAKS